MHPVIILEALSVVKRKCKFLLRGIKRYEGSEKEIVEQIIDDSWNKKGFFQVSSGHFQTFYSRDFGIVVNSLIYLGYKNKVIKTMDYVLSKFSKQGHVKVMLTKYGIGCDFPTYAPDSLAFILHSLYIINKKELVRKYKSYLEDEIEYFHNYVIDKKIGGIIKNRHFSSMKDYSIRKSSCYDLVMAYMVKNYADKLNLKNPLKRYNFRKHLMDNYWTGSFFLDDLSGNTHISGDAQTLPFWSGMVKDKKIFNKVLKTVNEVGLDKPLPLRYTIDNKQYHGIYVINLLNKDYESNNVWVHLGLLWMEVLLKFNKIKELRKHINNYSIQIKKYQNFMELYNSDLSLFKTFFYVSDESMSWIALYFYLKKQVAKKG